MKKYKKLHNIILHTYEVDPVAADVVAVLWAAERLAAISDKSLARNQLSELNKKRIKKGKCPVYIPYESELFPNKNSDQ